MPGKKVTNWTYDSGLGYGKNRTAFGAWGRFLTSNYIDRIINPKPTFKCLQQKDAFTVNDTEKGNGALTYPVGLITADEVVTAGDRFYEEDNSSSNRLFYLHKGYPYYTFSPSDFNGSGSTIFVVTGTGELSHTYAHYSNYIAPVINISAEYAITLIGKGTATDPYRIE